jgi:predicted nucleic acid-binding protein
MTKNAVRIFLDSNVILSGLLSDKGAPKIILDILSLKLSFLTGLTGQYNIIEIERNIKKKLPRALPVYKKYFPKSTIKIIPLPSAEEIRKYSGRVSEKDVPVLVSAIKGNVDFLLTGDKRHFEKLKNLRKYPFAVVSPSEFLDTILPEIIKRLSPKT